MHGDDYYKENSLITGEYYHLIVYIHVVRLNLSIIYRLVDDDDDDDDDAFHLCLLSYFFTRDITKWLVSYVVCCYAYNTGQ